MQLSSAPSKLVLAFANAGGKNVVPVTTGTAGAASLTEGFPALTRTPIVAGGIPPSGLDMNGILFAISALARWANAGGGFVYDSTFAANANVTGYPKGARVLRTDAKGYWLNTTDDNVTDPESAGAAAAGWVPDASNGLAAVTMTNANVTLTPLQYGLPVIVITGLLTGNLNLIFPSIEGEWVVVNNTTGAFTITAKTAAGTGVLAAAGLTPIIGDGTNIYSIAATSAQIQTISSSVAGNALTAGTGANTYYFRNATLTNGTPIGPVSVASRSIVVPSGATLGAINGVAARLVLLTAYNAGAPVQCIANLAGGAQLDETNLISPTTISAGATSASVIYSASAVGANSPYRIDGYLDITEVTAGTWATDATVKQGCGGQAIAAMSSLGYGQKWTDVTGSRTLGTTNYNTTGRPIQFCVSVAATGGGAAVSTTVGGVSTTGTFCFNGSAPSCSAPIIVPPGVSYSAQIGTGTGTLSAWSELR